MFGGRTKKQVFNALIHKQHYIAFINMLKNYPKFFHNFYRYITCKGKYPYKISIKTPEILINPTIYSYHDMLTVNEVFCRVDYPAKEDLKVVLDIGSNIGITALYFLTRNSSSKCYLFEPDNRNAIKLLKNLSNYKNRYIFVQKAVSHKKGILDFGIEETGRYGGIELNKKETIKVDSLHINCALEQVLNNEKTIDILKIDIEGLEEKTVNSIDGKYLNKIKNIYFESSPENKIFPDIFDQRQYGTVCQMKNKYLI